jgi:hypothetical protein
MKVQGHLTTLHNKEFQITQPSKPESFQHAAHVHWIGQTKKITNDLW